MIPQGLKFDNDKIDYTLLPFEALDEVVKVLMHGCKKYSKNNWKFVEPSDRYIKASFRHLISYNKGEKFDKETNLHHLAHATCCMLFKIYRDLEDSNK